MKQATIFLGLCVALTATLAVPASPKINHLNASPNLQSEKLSVRFNEQVKSVIQLRRLSTMLPRDYFSDLISETLHMTVKELLTKIEATFKGLDKVTREAVVQLNELIKSASPEVQKEIKEITNDAIKKVFDTIMPYLEDLGLILPVISSKINTHDSAADIIWALLGISLEDLVKTIANSMDGLLELLAYTIDDLKKLAAGANSEVGAVLVQIADQYLAQGRNLIIPTLDQLRALTGPAKPDYDSLMTSTDLLNAAVSSILGTNVQLAGFQSEVILPQLITLLDSTRDDLNQALVLSGDAEVQTKVMGIYDKAVDDVIRAVKPIFTTLLQFRGESRHDKRFPYNLLSSLVGIGAEDFKVYLQLASVKINDTLTSASRDIIKSSVVGGIMPAMKVRNIVYRNLRFSERLCKPLIETLKPLLNRKDNRNFEIPMHANVVETEWSNADGKLYNRDALISAVSKLLDFDVYNATIVLKTTMESLDVLTEVSLGELNAILESTGKIDVRQEILGIMNETLTDVHITLQPMLDVFLPFLPDPIRSNKDVALDIYTGINGVDTVEFLQYCRHAAKQITAITDHSAVQIKVAAAKAGPEVHSKIENLLQMTNTVTKEILKPFIDIAEPIFTPLRLS